MDQSKYFGMHAGRRRQVPGNVCVCVVNGRWRDSGEAQGLWIELGRGGTYYRVNSSDR